MNRGVLLVSMATILLAPALASAHARINASMQADQLRVITPRNTNAGNKEATRPCGTTTRSSVIPVFAPGEQVTLQLQETIYHPGYFQVNFSNSGADGTFTTNLTTVQHVGTTSMGAFPVTVTLPSCAVCDSTTPCTIQMIQYMTESNPPTKYYSCADIIMSPPASACSGTDTGTGTTREAVLGPEEESSVSGGGCGGTTKVTKKSVNASFGLLFAIPVVGLNRRRLRKLLRR